MSLSLNFDELGNRPREELGVKMCSPVSPMVPPTMTNQQGRRENLEELAREEDEVLFEQKIFRVEKLALKNYC